MKTRKTTAAITTDLDLLPRWEEFDERWNVHLDVEVGLPIQASEPDHAVVEIDCAIRIYSENGNRKTIGTITAYRIPYTEEFATFDILDAHSADVAGYLELFDDDGHISDKVTDQFGVFCAELFVLHKAEINKEFRGFGIGLIAARRLADSFAAGEALVAYQPYPQQFLEKEDQKGFPEALRKLERYWARLGSEPVKSAPGYWAFSMGNRLPSIEQILRGPSVASTAPTPETTAPSESPETQRQDGPT